MAIAFDTTGSTKLTAGALSATVDITAAATGAQVYCLVAIGANETSLTFTGWTQLLAADESTATHYGLFRRQKIAGDTTFTVSWTATSQKATIGWASYTGLDPNTPDELAAVTLHTTGTSFASPSLTPSTAAEWALFCCYARDTTAATDLPDGSAWTPDAALTERLDAANQAASTSTWQSLEFADSNAAVTQAAHSYTATAATAESHGAAFLLFLFPAAAAAGGGLLPQAPAWFPSAPSAPGAAPFTPWPQYEPVLVFQDVLAAATTVTATAAASLTSAPAPWNLPPQYAPGWFPGVPAAPGGEPFTPWPLGETGVNSTALTAALTITTAGAAALAESKPLNAASTVTAARAAAETTSKPLNAAVTVTAAAAAALAESKPLNAAATVTAARAASLDDAPPAPGTAAAPRMYVPAWFPGAPGTPAGAPFAPWPPWTGAVALAAPVVQNALSFPAVTAQDASAPAVAAMVSAPAVTPASGSAAAVAAQVAGSAVTQQASSSPAVSDG